MKKIQGALQEKAIVRGEITARFYNQSTLNPLEQAWNMFVRFLVKKTKDRSLFLKYYILGEIRRLSITTNVICNIGFEAICKRLAGTLTYTGEITYCALGTGTCSAVAGDTTLETESYRNLTASATASANVAYITAFFSETECNGTYKEFGNFIDGGAGADTGQLWSHICGKTWVKDAVTTLIVDCKYTFVSA